MSIFVPDSNEAPAPIAEIVLVVIPFSSVITSIIILEPGISISCFSDKPLSTYILLVSSSFSIGVVFVTVILLQVKLSVDNILGCFVSKSSIVIWFIDEIVLVVIPFSSVITSIIILEPGISISCFSDKPLSTYILLVSSSFSIGVVFETVILLQVKSSVDNILGCFVSKSSIVIWFIDEIVLVVIPFASVITSIIILEPVINLSCFSNNLLSTYILLVNYHFLLGLFLLQLYYYNLNR